MADAAAAAAVREAFADERVRRLLAERLGVTEMPDSPAAERAALTERLRELAPEALTGDPDAQADFSAIEEQLRELDRTAELERLAAEEHERRDAEAARVAAADERAAQTAQKAELERERDVELGRVERALASLAHAAAAALKIDAEIENLAHALGDHHPRLRARLEDRFAWRLRPVITNLPTLFGNAGREPLVGRRCVVCDHPERLEMEAASKEPGTSLRALEEQYGVSKSALSAHLRGHT